MDDYFLYSLLLGCNSHSRFQPYVTDTFLSPISLFLIDQCFSCILLHNKQPQTQRLKTINCHHCSLVGELFCWSCFGVPWGCSQRVVGAEMFNMYPVICLVPWGNGQKDGLSWHAGKVELLFSPRGLSIWTLHHSPWIRLNPWWLRASKSTKAEAARHSITSATFCWLNQVTGPAQIQCGSGPLMDMNIEGMVHLVPGLETRFHSLPV